jgi:hypothetical protein
MDIKYKIVKTIPEEHQIIVRFYSDSLPESSLVSSWNPDGTPKFYRTDYVITLPIPVPTGQALIDYIMSFCPTSWFDLQEKIKSSSVDTSMNLVSGLIGVESKVTVSRPLTLDEAKTQKITQINTKRDQLEASGFTYKGKVFDSDERSVQRINTAVQAAQIAALNGQSFSVVWTCQDNTTMTFTGTEILALPVALASHAIALHEFAKGLKAAVAAATSLTDLNTLNINEGWPT